MEKERKGERERTGEDKSRDSMYASRASEKE